MRKILISLLVICISSYAGALSYDDDMAKAREDFDENEVARDYEYKACERWSKRDPSDSIYRDCDTCKSQSDLWHDMRAEDHKAAYHKAKVEREAYFKRSAKENEANHQSWEDWEIEKYTQLYNGYKAVKDYVSDKAEEAYNWVKDSIFDNDATSGAFDDEYCLPEEEDDNLGYLNDEDVRDQANWDEADKKDREARAQKAYDKFKKEEAKLKAGDTNPNQDYGDGYLAEAYCILNQRDLRHYLEDVDWDHSGDEEYDEEEGYDEVEEAVESLDVERLLDSVEGGHARADAGRPDASVESGL